MKKLGTLLLLLSVSMFTIGCKDADKTTTTDDTGTTEDGDTTGDGSGDTTGTTDPAPEGEGA